MNNKIPQAVRDHMATLGAVGGAKSRRTLTPADARRMVEAREAKRKKALKAHAKKVKRATAEKTKPKKAGAKRWPLESLPGRMPRA